MKELFKYYNTPQPWFLLETILLQAYMYCIKYNQMNPFKTVIKKPCCLGYTRTSDKFKVTVM